MSCSISAIPCLGRFSREWLGSVACSPRQLLNQLVFRQLSDCTRGVSDGFTLDLVPPVLSRGLNEVGMNDGRQSCVYCWQITDLVSRV